MEGWCLGAPKCTAVEATRGEVACSTCKERTIKSQLYSEKKMEDEPLKEYMRKIEENNSGVKK